MTRLSSGAVLSGSLTLLFLICTVLPWFHAANVGTLGLELRPVPVQSIRGPGSDAGERASVASLDLDDLQEEAVQPRQGDRLIHVALRPILPRTIGRIEAIASLSIDRPPRSAVQA